MIYMMGRGGAGCFGSDGWDTWAAELPFSTVDSASFSGARDEPCVWDIADPCESSDLPTTESDGVEDVCFGAAAGAAAAGRSTPCTTRLCGEFCARACSANLKGGRRTYGLISPIPLRTANVVSTFRKVFHAGPSADCSLLSAASLATAALHAAPWFVEKTTVGTCRAELGDLELNMD